MYVNLSDKENMDVIIRKYNNLLIKLWFQIPPIIYHYKAKNTLHFNGKSFYYLNPWGVEKFVTKYKYRDMKYLITFLKTNKNITWNNE